MGQSNCRTSEQQSDSPMPSKLTKGTNHFVLHVCENEEINSFLSESSDGSDALDGIAQRVRGVSEFMEVLKSVHTSTDSYAQIIAPNGDWSFVHNDLSETLDIVRKNLKALDIHRRIMSARAASPGTTTASVISVVPQTSKMLTDNQLFVIALASSSAYSKISAQPADLLFSLNRDGESWGRFIDRADGYGFPMILALKVREHSDVILGAYIAEGLEESGSKFNGSADTFLFGIVTGSNGKFVTVRRATNFETNYCMLNRSSQYMPKGIGFGGDDKQPRLLIESDFRKVSLLLACRTYESGPLVENGSENEYLTEYSLDDLELWGFGGEDGARAQSERKALAEEMKGERRKVDIAKMIGNDVTGLIKKGVQAGERQGEADVIIEQRAREREDEINKKLF